MACLCGVSPSPARTLAAGQCSVAGNQKQTQAIAWRRQTPTAMTGQQAWRTWSVSCRNDVTTTKIAPQVVEDVTNARSSDGSFAPAEDLHEHFIRPNRPDYGNSIGFDVHEIAAQIGIQRMARASTSSSSSFSSAQRAAIVTQSCCAEPLTAGISRKSSPQGGLSLGWLRGTTEGWLLRGDRMTAGFHIRARRRSPREVKRRPSAVAAVLDPHSLVLLSDLANLSDFPVRIQLDPTREIITSHVTSELSEQAIKTVYLVLSLLFTWGCCVFGSMNDKFYDSDFYRKAGGDGTGHWLYDRQAEEEQAAREEMWSEDLLKEIEEKAEEVRKAEEEEEKKRKEVELV